MTPLGRTLRKSGWIIDFLFERFSSTRRLNRYAPTTTRDFQERLERILIENILQFWMSRCLDEHHGGYIVGFDADGQRLEGTTKGIVTQARMLWFFSRLVRSKLAEQSEHQEKLFSAADLGFLFLRDRLWDHEYGGFYWEVDERGGSVLNPQKHLYGQSFALYAISEFYLISQRNEVMSLASEVFEILESRAHDKTCGGYLENFKRDWSPSTNTQPPFNCDDAGIKLTNTHLHLLEAMMSFFEISDNPVARDRLLEIVSILSHSVVRKGPIACTDFHERDWTPRLDNNWNRVNYGHDLEIVYLLIDANRATGLPNQPYIELYRALAANALHFGYDRRTGAFFTSGFLGHLADRREKVWWVQAEALVASLRLYEITGDHLYWSVFESVLDFIEAHQVDWKVGEWHERINWCGRPSGHKAHLWKGAYHNGRAMIECIETLRRLDRAA